MSLWAVAAQAQAVTLAAPTDGPPPARLVSLTPEERAWVAAHPVLRIAMSPGLPPYYEFDAGVARPHGFVVEMLDLMAERSGLRVEYQRLPSFAASLNAMKKGEVEALPFVSPALAQHEDFLRVQPMLSANLVLLVRRDIPDISPTSNFGGYRVAVQEGSAGDMLMRSRFPQAQTQRYADPGEAMRAVASGDADLHIGYRHVAVHYIEKYLMANVQVRGRLGPGLTGLGPAVRSDLPVLRGILDKALASITQRERARLAQSWLPPGALDDEAPRELVLTEGERAWLDAHGRVRVGYDAAFSPVTFQTDMTQMRGLGADFMRLASTKAGLTILSETGTSFSEAYQLGVKGEIDVLVGAVRTTERRSDFDFVGPFLRVPTGIVTRSGSGLLVTKLDELGRSRLALLNDHFLIPQLRVRYPMLQLVSFATQDKVLEAVAEGRADVAIGNLKVVNQLINDRYTGRVRVTGTVPDADSELYFAVRKDLPELSRLLRKGLDAVSEAEAADIERRWLVVEVRPGFSRDEVLRAAALIVVLLTVLLTYLYLLRRGNQRLRQARQIERDARQLAEETTTARGRFIGYLTHELRGTIGAIATGAGMLKADDVPADKREALADAIEASAQGFLGLLEATLQYEQQLERAVQLQPEPADIALLWPQMLAPWALGAQGKGLRLAESLTVAPGVSSQAQVDVQRLRQVFNNLVGNAIKFTPQGQVCVEGRIDDSAGQRHFTLDVRDCGPGLSEPDLQRLFQPYAQGEQGRTLRQGAGLGLAITRQIVLAMGGQIDAGLAAEGGARFTVTLPLV